MKYLYTLQLKENSKHLVTCSLKQFMFIKNLFNRIVQIWALILELSLNKNTFRLYKTHILDLFIYSTRIPSSYKSMFTWNVTVVVKYYRLLYVKL